MSPSRLPLILCMLLLGAACSAPATRTDAVTAGANGEAAGAQQVAAVEEEDPIVCRAVPTTGTRVARKTCMRQSEIDRRQRDAAEMLGEVQRRSVLNNQTPE